MQAFISINKSGLNAAFFWFQILFAAVYVTPVSGLELSGASVPQRLYEAAIDKKLDQQSVWFALLHVENGHSNVTDRSFLLSLPDFTPARELRLTINFLFGEEPDRVCRFPARYLWLRQNLDVPDLPVDQCPEIKEFRQKVPLDEISLMFASERISQPASMLGHAFLKFSGRNKQGQEVSHAISFYTDANTLNLPKLLFDSLVIGKQGYFSLSPYYEQQQRYVDEEQRNIWEYRLFLDKNQKELIRMHILELKQSNLTYFFQKYNCATVLNFIIALSGKSLPESGWWVTPKDLIKHAQQAGLVADTRIVTPSRWLYRALADQVSVEERSTIRSQVALGNAAEITDGAGSEKSYIRLELANAYNQYAYLNGDMAKDVWKINDSHLAQNRKKFFSDMTLSSGTRNNPLDSPSDSQIAITAQNDNSGNRILFTILPVSHTLSDDNRSYASETSLQLFSTTIKFSEHSGSVDLDRLTIFDMLSLVPYDEITGGNSVHLHIAVEPQLNGMLESNRVFATSGAFGFTKRLVDDVDIYSLLGGGVGHTGDRGYIYPTLEAGVIVREVWDMKSLFTLTRTDNQLDMGSHYYTIALVQSKFIDKTKTFQIDWKRDFNENVSQNTVAMTIKNIF